MKQRLRFVRPPLEFADVLRDSSVEHDSVTGILRHTS